MSIPGGGVRLMAEPQASRRRRTCRIQSSTPRSARRTPTPPARSSRSCSGGRSPRRAASRGTRSSTPAPRTGRRRDQPAPGSRRRGAVLRQRRRRPATLEKAEQLGGKVTQPAQEVPGVTLRGADGRPRPQGRHRRELAEDGGGRAGLRGLLPLPLLLAQLHPPDLARSASSAGRRRTRSRAGRRRPSGARGRSA